MSTTVRRKKTQLNPWLRGLLFLTTATSSVQAEDFMESEGLFDILTGRDVNKTQFMQSLRLTIGGWLEGGYTFNPDDPRDGFNGPLSFDDRANELVGDELYLFFDRPANTEGDRWDFGWRADFLFGTDARFTQASGLDNRIIGDDTFRFYKFAIPQLYAEAFVPFGKGITVKIGHFYTIIGNEVVTAPDNFFYSHAYTMQYGEPFTHTGFLANSLVTHNISVSAGGVLGWDNFSKDPENLNFLGRVSWSSDDARTSLAAAIITGDVSKVSGNSGMPDRNRTMYSTVFNHDITDRLHYTLQHDLGIEQNAVANHKAAQWFGINQYLFFRNNETLSTGLRFEWFRDADGNRVVINGLSGPTNYFAITAGLNWKLLRWITFRPEVRYDWMYSSNGFKAFDNNSDTNQFVIAGDLIIQF
ncbi:MAG: porin [Candidatus Nitrosoglobus sp.]